MSFHARYGPLNKIPMNIRISHDARLSLEFIPAGSSEVPATACCQIASRPGFSLLKPASHNSRHQDKNRQADTFISYIILSSSNLGTCVLTWPPGIVLLLSSLLQSDGQICQPKVMKN